MVRAKSAERSTIVDEELHDLKLRFELLEGDRKAYYETSQWAIRRNKEEISQFRKQNKEISEKIARLKKNEIENQGSRVVTTELEKLDHRICEIHKKYDELQAEARAKEEKLREMFDQLSDIKREAELVKSNLKDSPQAKEIRSLENRLDKAMIKYNEAQSIRKTYEQIAKRLQEERLTFDNQLAAFEKSLKAKRQDAMELELMSRDANHAKEVAKAELTHFEQQINEERKHREKELQQQKEIVKQRLDNAEKWDKKIFFMENAAGRAVKDTDVNKDQYDEAKEKKMMEYEETMRLIKEATGVSAISEVIAKFQSQGETNTHLKELQRQNEARIEELKIKKSEILAKLQELKLSGELKNSQLKKTVEDFESHLLKEQMRLSDAKAKYERVAKLLNNAKSGIQYLYDKLECIQLEKKQINMSDETAAQVLDLAVQKLEILVHNLEGKEIVETPQASSVQQPVGEPVSILHINPALLPPYNTRVKLSPFKFEEYTPEDEDEDDDEYGEILDRETIKKHANQMINARLKAKQPKKTKKKKSTKDEDDDE